MPQRRAPTPSLARINSPQRAVAASDGDDDADVRLGMETAAGEEKFDAIAIEASAAPFEDNSFASASSVDEQDAAELLAALCGEEDYFASASSDADTPARKGEGRIARAYSISEDEKECDDSVLDKLSDVLEDLESQLVLQREVGDDEAAAATEAQIEDCKGPIYELYRQSRNLRTSTLQATATTMRVPRPETKCWTPGSKRGSRVWPPKLTN